MYRSPAAMAKTVQRQIALQKIRSQTAGNKIIQPPCDVFINHRGTDTKRSVASLLYHQLCSSRIPSFLDNKNMKPGDKLFDKIDNAIMECKIGIAVFSPRYCESYFCLHELALMMDFNKKVIPIFCDVKPSELRVLENDNYSQSELNRFNDALEEAKHTVGLAFDTTKGNYWDVVTNAVDIVIQSLLEMDDEKYPLLPTKLTSY